MLRKYWNKKKEQRLKKTKDSIQKTQKFWFWYIVVVVVGYLRGSQLVTHKVWASKGHEGRSQLEFRGQRAPRLLVLERKLRKWWNQSSSNQVLPPRLPNPAWLPASYIPSDYDRLHWWWLMTNDHWSSSWWQLSAFKNLIISELPCNVYHTPVYHAVHWPQCITACGACGADVVHVVQCTSHTRTHGS